MGNQLLLRALVAAMIVVASSALAEDQSAVSAPPAVSSYHVPAHRPTVGWIEKVSLSPGRIVLNAKMDTGADYSSLHAHDIQEFDREGVTWVKFDVMDRVGKHHVLEQPVIRTSLIKKPSGKHQRRNVIRLGICLGTTYMKADVNLVDRSDFKLQMLVGRNFLSGSFSIDPAVSFTSEPYCPEQDRPAPKAHPASPQTDKSAE